MVAVSSTGHRFVLSIRWNKSLLVLVLQTNGNDDILNLYVSFVGAFLVCSLTRALLHYPRSIGNKFWLCRRFSLCVSPSFPGLIASRELLLEGTETVQYIPLRWLIERFASIILNPSELGIPQSLSNILYGT